jgi:predicted MFS family arabinose efflux permease
MLLFILSLCGFSGALATRLLDPLITTIATDFATSVGVVALLSSAFALPFGLSQPFLGPTGDAFGKAVVIKVAVAVLALCLLASALAPNLTVLFITRVLGGVAAGGIMPVCMAMIGDSFPLAVRQVAMSRYIGATLIGQLVGVSVGGMVAEWIGWRGVLGCAAVLAAIAAGAAMMMLPQPKGHRRLSRAFRTPLPAIAWSWATRAPLCALRSCFWKGSQSTASCLLSGSTCARAGPAGCAKPGS